MKISPLSPLRLRWRSAQREQQKRGYGVFEKNYIFASRYGWMAFIRSSALLTPNGRGWATPFRSITKIGAEGGFRNWSPYALPISRATSAPATAYFQSKPLFF